jgi:hypothetical protein
MSRQYKLRLRDGTILAVDHQGLRTWLIDDKAMVQPMGARTWQSLREVLAQESLAPAPRPEPVRVEPPPPAPAPVLAAPEPEPEPPPPVEPLAPVEVALHSALSATIAAASPDRTLPPLAIPDIEPEPAGALAPVIASEPIESPMAITEDEVSVSLTAPDETEVPEPPMVMPIVEVTAPVMEAAAPVMSAPDEGMPIIPFADEAPVAPPVAVSARVVPAKSIDLGKVAREATLPAFADSTPHTAIPEDTVPIRLKPLDRSHAPARPAAKPRATAPQSRRREDDVRTIPLKPLEHEPPEPVAAPTADEDVLEELEMIEEHAPPNVGERLAQVRHAAEAQVTRLAPMARTLAHAVSAGIDRLKHARSSAHAGAGDPPRSEPLKPPAPLSDVPVLRLAKIDDDDHAGARTSALRAAALGVRRFAPRVPLLAACLIAALTWRTWTPWLGPLLAAFTKTPERTPTARPAVPMKPTEPDLPKEVLVAARELPHLSPETVQLVMSRSPFAPSEPADVFRRAYEAALRGASALPPDEARELKALEKAVIGALRPIERERFEAYERVGSSGRDLLAAEDARVLGLFARGTRALAPPRRQRLQELLAKAIAAAFGSNGGTTGATSRAASAR